MPDALPKFSENDLRIVVDSVRPPSVRSYGSPTSTVADLSLSAIRMQDDLRYAWPLGLLPRPSKTTLAFLERGSSDMGKLAL